MSKVLSDEDIRFQQRFLKSGGFYKKAIDGEWGKDTDAAFDTFVAETEQLKNQLGAFDKRSEDNIATLQIPAQRLARLFLKTVQATGMDVRIISGNRTYAEQNRLYAIGRTIKKGEPKVTNAKGGQSNHNFGIAWDIGIFEGKVYVTKSAPYEKAAKLVKVAALKELEWGGDWKSFPDIPHYQLSTGKSIKDVRKLFEDGERYW